MMRIKAKQVATWEREELERWFTSAYPERSVGRSHEEIAAYLDSRHASAVELGFTHPQHLRFLIGYEIGCGVPWPSEGQVEGPSANVVRLLRQRELHPDQRIEAAERLLYGEPDD